MANEDKILRELIKEIATEQNIKEYDVTIKSISSGGANYTSQLFLINILGDKVLRLFAKVAVLGEKMREVAPLKVFDTERFFYTKLSSVYEEIEENYKVPREQKLSFPKFYGCNENYLEETIVLENLVHQGFTDYNRLVSVDWPYAESAVTELAKLHALSFAYKRQNPDKFEIDVHVLKFEWPMEDEQRDMFWNNCKKTAMNAVRKENKERLEHYLEQSTMFLIEDFLAPISSTVLIHGDYRVSNLLHKYRDDGTVTIKIVDFQTIHGGCPVSDLIYFMITGTDEEFRNQHYQSLVEHYYEQLCTSLRRLDLDPDEVYPRRIYNDELKEKLRHALPIAIFGLPLVTVEAENAPMLNKESDLTSFIVEKTSDLYTERLNGVINDCIRWGVL